MKKGGEGMTGGGGSFGRFLCEVPKGRGESHAPRVRRHLYVHPYLYNISMYKEGARKVGTECTD